MRLAAWGGALFTGEPRLPTMTTVAESQTSVKQSQSDVTARMQRVIARQHTRRPSISYFLAQMGVLGACAFGAWWTVDAVADGRPWAMVFRFLLSVGLGLYYLVLARIVRFAR